MVDSENCKWADMRTSFEKRLVPGTNITSVIYIHSALALWIVGWAHDGYYTVGDLGTEFTHEFEWFTAELIPIRS